jgi:hypothetical protein
MSHSPPTRHSGGYNHGAELTSFPLVKHGHRIERLVFRHVQVSAVFCCGLRAVRARPPLIEHNGWKLAELAECNTIRIKKALVSDCNK